MPVPPPVSVDLTVSKGHDANGVSQRLLAGLRARTREEEDRYDTFHDPDDSGPRLSVTFKQSPDGETYACSEILNDP